MQEVAYVEKKGKNEFHHYTYATSADVLDKINKALVKNKLCSVVIPEIISMLDVTTAKGNLEHLATVKVDVMLIDAESGETVSLIGIGSGQDSGDKAVMKAQTAGIKYAYMMSFAIATGDDPESDCKTDEESTIQEAGSSAQKADNVSTRPVKMAKPNENCCSKCGASLTKGVFTVSMKKYGKQLCMKCQKQVKNVA